MKDYQLIMVSQIEFSRELTRIVYFDLFVIMIIYLFFSFFIVGIMFGEQEFSNDMIRFSPITGMFLLIGLLSFRDQVKNMI